MQIKGVRAKIKASAGARSLASQIARPSPSPASPLTPSRFYARAKFPGDRGGFAFLRFVERANGQMGRELPTVVGVAVAICPTTIVANI